MVRSMLILLDVVEPTTTEYDIKFKSLIAFTLENVSDGSSSTDPDYANGETVSNGSGVSGVVYENVLALTMMLYFG